MTFACDFLKVPFASHERKDDIQEFHGTLNRSISGIALAVPKSPAAASRTASIIARFFQPSLKVAQRFCGLPQSVASMKQGMDGVEILVDRGTGFAFLAVDTVPDYTDTQPMPAADKALSGNTKPSTAKATTSSANGAMW